MYNEVFEVSEHGRNKLLITSDDTQTLEFFFFRIFLCENGNNL